MPQDKAHLQEIVELMERGDQILAVMANFTHRLEVSMAKLSRSVDRLVVAFEEAHSCDDYSADGGPDNKGH